MKTVKVYGQLAKYLGQSTFKFDVITPAEAIKALLVNFQGLDQWLLDSQKDGVAYKIKVGEEKIYKDNIDDLALPFTDKNVFSIRPVIQGSCRGFTRFLTGALILGAGVLAGGGFFGSAIAKNLGAISFVKQMGFIMALGGVAEMLSPQPTLPDMNQALISDNFSISGLRNNATVGTAIPICYGRAYVGSTIISTGLDTDEVAI